MHCCLLNSLWREQPFLESFRVTDGCPKAQGYDPNVLWDICPKCHLLWGGAQSLGWGVMDKVVMKRNINPLGLPWVRIGGRLRPWTPRKLGKSPECHATEHSLALPSVHQVKLVCPSTFFISFVTDRSPSLWTCSSISRREDQGALGESLRNSAAGDGGYKQKELKNAQIAPAPS